MKNRIGIFVQSFLLVVLFSSCATLFNERHQIIKIEAKAPLKLTGIDSAKTKWSDPSWKEYCVKRSIKPFHLQFNAGDTIINYTLRRRLSPEFWLYNGIFYWTGCIVDMFSSKRHAYPPDNYFRYDSVNKKIRHSTLPFIKPHSFYLKLGTCYINVYQPSMMPIRGHVNGILGLHFSGEYYIDNYQSLSFEIANSVQGGLKSRAKRRYFQKDIDSIQRVRLTNAWTTLNYRLRQGHWSGGVGISFSFSEYMWRTEYFINYDTVYEVPNWRIDTFRITRINRIGSGYTNYLRTGLNLNLEYKFSNRLSTGLNWQIYLTDLRTKTLSRADFLNFYFSYAILRVRPKQKTFSYADD